MATKDNDEKRFVMPLVLGCLGAIGLLHILFLNEFLTLTNDGLFIAVDIIAILLFGYFSYKAWVGRNDPNKDKFRWFAIIVAAGICIWVGTWCSQYRQDKKAGIEYKYDK